MNERLPHLGTCKLMKASLLGTIFNLCKKSKYRGVMLCLKK